MSDDTAQAITELHTVVPQRRPKISSLQLVIAGVAPLILFLAALSFVMSFNGLQQFVIESDLVDRSLTWIAPVAIDVTQAGATAVFLVLRALNKGKPALWFAASVVAATVLLSVTGNAVHAWQNAERNLARMAAGEDLGFIQQEPWISAVVAAIFPLLWLVTFHLFVLMLPTNKQAPTAPHLAATPPVTAAAADATIAASVARHEEPSRPQGCYEQVSATALSDREEDPASTRLPIEQVVAPLPSSAATTNNPGTARATVKHVEATTRNGYMQTQDGLLQFINDSDFHETVKIVASMMVTAPTLRQIDVADRLDIDKSTVSRRWRQFRQAAESEGFSVPPLPVAEAGDSTKKPFVPALIG
ncbi:hypothetical protein HBA53_25630 (plasmid) [Rhodococcus pyridinivorans]|uniref:hypothetical protein n=1 Tax=Rhodococcus pyridinivorans TaxID=103816 RepID=UPI001C2FAC50|nr:hypothetical protein [Rhodococcus pyridinivorans]QXF84461.1 hypothetical protein HBA53_25630 [Rhodococcus pyridinivorans]